jgi:hypothetical protein
MELQMRWVLAILFGLIGFVLGKSLTGRPEEGTIEYGVPVVVGSLLAILGAVLGGASDIIRALNERDRKGRGSDGNRANQAPPTA